MSSQKNKMSYTTKYVVLACSFLLAVNTLLSIVLMTQDREAMRVLIHERMLAAANTAAASIDGDVLASITSADARSNAENYQEVMGTLRLFLYHMDMKYVYAIKHLGSKNFVFIADPDPIDPGKFGEQVVYTEALYRASQGTPSVDETPFTDRWGDFYSAYAPVYDSEGNLAGIIGVDYDAHWYEDRIAINTASIMVITVFSLLIGSAIIIFITGRFRKKIKSLYGELADLSSEMVSLNKELSANVNLQKKSSSTWGSGDTTDLLVNASSFDALGDKIRQTRKDVKEYVSFIREQDYVDPLTGVGNKTAYLEYAKDVDAHMGDESMNYSAIVLDINNLRSVNDKYGLKIGDQMIVDLSTLLLRVFDAKTIFRFGSGDFIIIMENVTPNGLSKAIEDLHGKIAVFNACEKTYEAHLSISLGSAVFDPEKDHHCDDVVKRATKELSQNKASYYQQNGDRRKR